MDARTLEALDKRHTAAGAQATSTRRSCVWYGASDPDQPQRPRFAPGALSVLERIVRCGVDRGVDRGVGQHCPGRPLLGTTCASASTTHRQGYKLAIRTGSAGYSCAIPRSAHARRHVATHNNTLRACAWCHEIPENPRDCGNLATFRGSSRSPVSGDLFITSELLCRLSYPGRGRKSTGICGDLHQSAWDRRARRAHDPPRRGPRLVLASLPGSGVGAFEFGPAVRAARGRRSGSQSRGAPLRTVRVRVPPRGS